MRYLMRFVGAFLYAGVLAMGLGGCTLGKSQSQSDEVKARVGSSAASIEFQKLLRLQHSGSHIPKFRLQSFIERYPNTPEADDLRLQMAREDFRAMEHLADTSVEAEAHNRLQQTFLDTYAFDYPADRSGGPLPESYRRQLDPMVCEIFSNPYFMQQMARYAVQNPDSLNSPPLLDALITLLRSTHFSPKAMKLYKACSDLAVHDANWSAMDARVEDDWSTLLRRHGSLEDLERFTTAFPDSRHIDALSQQIVAKERRRKGLLEPQVIKPDPADLEEVTLAPGPEPNRHPPHRMDHLKGERNVLMGQVHDRLVSHGFQVFMEDGELGWKKDKTAYLFKTEETDQDAQDARISSIWKKEEGKTIWESEHIKESAGDLYILKGGGTWEALSSEGELDRESFYNPRRAPPYLANELSSHQTRNAAIDALANQFDKSPGWVEHHMGSSNELKDIHAKLQQAKSTGFSKGKSSLSELERFVDETEDIVRRRLRATDRKPGEAGYSLSDRREAARRTLIRQGYSSNDASLTVRDMEKYDMLPDPPRQ